MARLSTCPTEVCKRLRQRNGSYQCTLLLRSSRPPSYRITYRALGELHLRVDLAIILAPLDPLTGRAVHRQPELLPLHRAPATHARLPLQQPSQCEDYCGGSFLIDQKASNKASSLQRGISEAVQSPKRRSWPPASWPTAKGTRKGRMTWQTLHVKPSPIGAFTNVEYVAHPTVTFGSHPGAKP
jgi:hypothetical protein